MLRTRISQALGEVPAADVEGHPVLQWCASLWPHEEILEAREKEGHRSGCTEEHLLGISPWAPGLLCAGAGWWGRHPRATLCPSHPGAELQDRWGPDLDNHPPWLLSVPPAWTLMVSLQRDANA